MARRCLPFLALVFSAANATAQIWDLDDYVDPRRRDGTLFLSRLLAGVVIDDASEYRPLHQDVGVLSLSNSLYWKNFQFDYKHSEARGSDESGAMHRQRCGCSPPIYFPSPPLTPSAPVPGRKELLQVAWYHAWPSTPDHVPPMRYRLGTSWQPLDTIVTSGTTGQIVERLSGHEQTIALDGDTFVRFGKHELYGSFRYAWTEISGTTEDGTLHTVAYTARVATWPLGRALVHGTLTLAAVSGHGVKGVNVVNPAVEVFLHNHRMNANFHMVWSPQATRSRATGWRTTNQIALLVDRELLVRSFR